MAEQTPFRVVAIEVGVYGHWREIGDEFEISGLKAFSEVWMKKLAKTKADDDEETAEDAVDDPKPVSVQQNIDEMDDEKLIAYAKINCMGLTLSRTMKDETMRERIRDYLGRQAEA